VQKVRNFILHFCFCFCSVTPAGLYSSIDARRADVLSHADYWWGQKRSLSLNDCTEGAVTTFSGRLFQSRIVREKTRNSSRSHVQYDLCAWNEQELSYRKQIARQLRIQYVEGIRRPKYYTVTLKSRLRVTQDHCKRNHWVDHTRLTISRVIGRWILSWPWNVGQRSLKVIEISAIRKRGAISYSPFIVTMAVSVAVCETFSATEWREIETQVRGRSRSLKMTPFDRPLCDFLLVGHSKYSSILYYFQVNCRWIISWPWNLG